MTSTEPPPPVFEEGETRTRLLRAAAHLFARRGIDAVKIHEIHRLAGQRNESAVHYHFGNRWNLVTAILEESDLTAAQVRPKGAPAPTSPTELLASVARNLSLGLQTPEGRDWLRIVSQLMARYPELAGRSKLSRGPVIAVGLLQELLPQLPPEVVERRTMIVLRFMTDQIAERARNLDGGDDRAVPADERQFLDELVGMCAAMLTVNVPGTPRRGSRGSGPRPARR